MSNEVAPKRRRRHVARRSRNVVAGLSAAAFVGFGGTMALVAHGTPATATTTNGNARATTPQTQATTPVDPFAPLGGSNSYNNQSRSDTSGNWGAQPAPAQSFSGGAAGGNTSTHGS